MKPQDGQHYFLKQVEEPIVSTYMPELVTADSFLKVMWHFMKTMGKQKNGLPEAKRHRTGNLARKADRGVDAHKPAHLNHCFGKRLQPLSPFQVEPESAIAESQPGQSGQRTHQQNS